MIIAVDFDRVIHDQDNPPPGKKMGPPMPGALEAMRALHGRGHTLVIFTVRAAEPGHVRDWLRYFKIPFHRVTNIKEDFDIFIDDKAFHFNGWDDTLSAFHEAGILPLDTSDG